MRMSCEGFEMDGRRLHGRCGRPHKRMSCEEHHKGQAPNVLGECGPYMRISCEGHGIEMSLERGVRGGPYMRKSCGRPKIRVTDPEPVEDKFSASVSQAQFAHHSK